MIDTPLRRDATSSLNAPTTSPSRDDTWKPPASHPNSLPKQLGTPWTLIPSRGRAIRSLSLQPPPYRLASIEDRLDDIRRERRQPERPANVAPVSPPRRYSSVPLNSASSLAHAFSACASS